MKTKKLHQNGHGPDPFAKAAAAEKLAEIARKHRKMLKAEYKQARKSYKQAKKAAERARREADAAEIALKARQPSKRRPKTSVATRAKARPVKNRLAATDNSHHEIVPTVEVVAVPAS